MFYNPGRPWILGEFFAAQLYQSAFSSRFLNTKLSPPKTEHLFSLIKQPLFRHARGVHTVNFAALYFKPYTQRTSPTEIAFFRCYAGCIPVFHFNVIALEGQWTLQIYKAANIGSHRTAEFLSRWLVAPGARHRNRIQWMETRRALGTDKAQNRGGSLCAFVGALTLEF